MTTTAASRSRSATRSALTARSGQWRAFAAQARGDLHRRHGQARRARSRSSRRSNRSRFRRDRSPTSRVTRTSRWRSTPSCPPVRSGAAAFSKYASVSPTAGSHAAVDPDRQQTAVRRDQPARRPDAAVDHLDRDAVPERHRARRPPTRRWPRLTPPPTRRPAPPPRSLPPPAFRARSSHTRAPPPASRRSPTAGNGVYALRELQTAGGVPVSATADDDAADVP